MPMQVIWHNQGDLFLKLMLLKACSKLKEILKYDFFLQEKEVYKRKHDKNVAVTFCDFNCGVDC